MFKKLLLPLSALLFAVTAPLAWAQDDENDDGEIIDLIEVVGEAGYRATAANSATGLSIPLDEIRGQYPGNHSGRRVRLSVAVAT